MADKSEAVNTGARSLSEEHYRLLFENANDAMLIADENAHYIDANRQAEQLTGYSRAELLNMSLADLTPDIGTERGLVLFQEFRLQGRMTGQYSLIRKDGTLIEVEFSAIRIKDGLYQSILRNVTDRNASEYRLREESEIIETINRVGQTLAAELDLQKVVQAVTDAATELCGAQFGAFFYNAINEQGELYTLYTLSGVDRAAFAQFPMPRNTHMFGPTFRGEGIVRIDDVHHDPRYAQNPPYFGMPKGHLPVTSYLAAPVISISGEVIGGLFFGHSEPGMFTARHERILAGLASQAAIAIDNARLYEKAQREIAQRRKVEQELREANEFHRKLERQLTYLVEASTNLLSSLSLTEILPTILNLSQQLVAADAYAVWRYFPSQHMWRALAQTGLSQTFQDTTGEALSSAPPFNQVILADDVEQFPALSTRLDVYRQEGIRSLLAVPLSIHGHISGSIVFYYRELQQFKELDVRVASALANIAAAAIGSAELYQEQEYLYVEAEQTSQRWEFLAQASSVLTSSLDYHATLQTVAQLAVPVLGNWCSLSILDKAGDLDQIAIAHSDPRMLEVAHELNQRYPTSKDHPDQRYAVLETGQPVIVAPVTDAMLVAGARDEGHLNLMRQLNIKSVMFIPLKARDQEIGVLAVANSNVERPYQTSDLMLAQELARRAAIAIDNARLYAEAQEAIRGRDEFLSVAAHELKTPVTSIQGFAQLTLRQFAKADALDKDKIIYSFNRITDQTQRLSAFVSQLLDISRIQAGKLILEKQTVDLVEVVKLAAANVQGMTDQHTISVQAPELPKMRVDSLRIEQLITNLLTNAVKFSPDGGQIEIVISSNENNIEISVTDQGVGVPPDKLPFIFQRFYQVDQHSNLGGMGLGLYISRQIVELHGGAIRAELPPEGGTRFIITLPLQ